MNSHSFDWAEVFDAVHNDLVITDSKGVVIYANKATEKLYSVPRNELIGKTVDQLEQNKIFTPSITKKVLKDKKKQTLIQESKIGTKILVTANPIFHDNGEIKGVVSYSYDVTEMLHLKEYVNKMEEEMRRVRHELFELRHQTGMADGIIASSPVMKQVIHSVDKIADVAVSVLLTGESGVGKSAIAKYIHQHSNRKKAPLVEINCGTIPEALLESELFGYEPGSFSGARNQGKKGLVEEAEGGTLFLDEIGELPLPLQVKLLTLIQEKKFYRVGGTRPIQVNFRLIAATNVDLKQKVQEGKFRQDLFFRLSVVPIHIPPLRQRLQDIYVMIMDFTNRFKALYDKEKRFSEQAIEQMLKYDWPGNVRELEHMVERLVLTAEGPTIGIEDLPDVVAGSRNPLMLEGKTLSEMMETYEAKIIQNAYAKCKSSPKLAEYLGISQPTAIRKIQKYVDGVHK